MKTTATTEAVSSNGMKKCVERRNWRQIAPCASEKPNLDRKKNLPAFGAGRESQKSPKMPALVVGQKPYGKCQYIAVLVALFTIHLAAKEPDPIWGKPKEGVVIGMRHYAQMSGNVIITICACQVTNYMNNLVLPATEYQTLEFDLRDKNSHSVPLTKEGKKYGHKLQTVETRAMKASHHLRNLSRFGVDDPDPIALLEINKCFKIDEEGDYELVIQVRLLKANGTNSDLDPAIFDPIKSKIHLRPSP